MYANIYIYIHIDTERERERERERRTHIRYLTLYSRRWSPGSPKSRRTTSGRSCRTRAARCTTRSSSVILYVRYTIVTASTIISTITSTCTITPMRGLQAGQVTLLLALPARTPSCASRSPGHPDTTSCSHAAQAPPGKHRVGGLPPTLRRVGHRRTAGSRSSFGSFASLSAATSSASRPRSPLEQKRTASSRGLRPCAVHGRRRRRRA